MSRRSAGIEVFLAGVAAHAMSRLPRWMILLFARFASKMAYWFGGKGKRIGLVNLELALGDQLDKAARRKVLRQVYYNFAVMVLDIFWFSHNTAARLDRWFRFDESCNQLLCDGPYLGVTAHFGNWEIMGMAMAQAGYPMLSVAAPLKNAEVDRIFIEIREKTGQTIVPQKGAIKVLVKALKGTGRMAVLLDQNISPKEGGVFIDFFGLPAAIGTAPAALAVKLKPRIVFGLCTLQNDGSYLAYVPGVIEAEEYDGLSPKELTQLMTLKITAEIAKHPASWLWLYKRWKFIPDSADPADYPFYARTMKEREIRS